MKKLINLFAEQGGRLHERMGIPLWSSINNLFRLDVYNSVVHKQPNLRNRVEDATCLAVREFFFKIKATHEFL
jgi:hypothetical protein